MVPPRLNRPPRSSAPSEVSRTPEVPSACRKRSPCYRLSPGKPSRLARRGSEFAATGRCGQRCEIGSLRRSLDLVGGPGFEPGASRSRTAVVSCPSVSRRLLPCPPVSSCTRAGSSSCPPVTSCIPWLPRMGDTAVTRMKHRPGVCHPREWSREASRAARARDHLLSGRAASDFLTTSCAPAAAIGRPRSSGRPGLGCRRESRRRGLWAWSRTARRAPTIPDRPSRCPRLEC